MNNTFKDNWEKTDETCPTCGKITKRVRGITRQNVKRLLIPQWNLNELIFTIMIIMVLLLAFVYQSETKVCRDWVTSMTQGGVEQCKSSCEYRCELNDPNKVVPYINNSNKTIPIINFTLD